MDIRDGAGTGDRVLDPLPLMTGHGIGPDAAFGGWLMPVVPPMVSAANGALLIPFVAPGRDGSR